LQKKIIPGVNGLRPKKFVIKKNFACKIFFNHKFFASKGEKKIACDFFFTLASFFGAKKILLAKFMAPKKFF